MVGKKNEKKEYCVLCGKIIEVLRERPLSERKCYIEGAGQLCFECYHDLYISSSKEDVIRLKL